MSTVFSAQYFPTIQYMAAYIGAEDPLIDGFENMQKQSYRNRCYILGANGKLMLNIPTEKNRVRRQVKDIRICYAEDWQKEHYKSLEAAYRRSPYFEFYEHYFEEIFNAKYDYLFDLNNHIMERLLKILQSDKEIKYTEEYKSDWDVDYRETFHPKKPHDQIPAYHQVFEERFGFTGNLSIIDLICNQGPEAKIYLNNLI